MGRKRRKAALPAAGTAFAVPLEDGRFSVCRVIRVSTDNKTECILVASSAWIGDEAPSPNDPALRPILHLTHHAWENKPDVRWVAEPQPGDFIPIGTIEATAAEMEMECRTYGGWESFRIQPLAQWRWDNDRDAVLAEDVERDINKKNQRQDARRKRDEYLARVTLEELRDHRFFAGWNDYPPAKAIRASRKIMTDTVDQLLNLGADATETDRLAVLQRCIESFNEVDADMNHFIETVERDDICEEFEAIVHACGLGAHEDLADEWRDW